MNHIRDNHKVCEMRDQGLEFEKSMTKLLEAPKLGFDGVWCCIFFVLFLVKLSSNTLITKL